MRPSSPKFRLTTVIPVYNGEKHILATLRSLEHQTLRPDRVVVVDDGSSDRTEEIVRSFRAIKCDWLPNKANLGLYPNQNRALEFAAETQFLHILHANDLIKPDFFSLLVPPIENGAGYAMSYCGHEFITEDGLTTARIGRPDVQRPSEISKRQFLQGQLELKPIQVHSVVLRTNYRPSPAKFRTDLLQVADMAFHAELGLACDLIYARPEILADVRIHNDSGTSKNISNLNAWVLDELKVMTLIDSMMNDHGMRSPGRLQKIKLLFAARTHVKIKSIKKVNPAYAQAISDASKPLVGSLRWRLAALVVAIRDALIPQADTTRERLGLQ